MALAFEAPRTSVMNTTASPMAETGDPGWDPAWRLGAERLRQGGQPLRHAGRIVIHDVINPRCPAGDRGTREAGGVVDVSERPNAATAANDRDAPLANVVHHPTMFAYGGARSIERPVAQDHALQTGLANDRGFQIADRFKRVAKRRRRLWIERVLLCLYRASRSRIRPTRKALRDEPAYAGRPRGGQQIIRTLCAQSVCRGESPVEIAQIDLHDGSEFVNDNLRLLPLYHLLHGRSIKRVGDDRRGANSPQKVSFGGRAR